MNAATEQKLEAARAMLVALNRIDSVLAPPFVGLDRVYARRYAAEAITQAEAAGIKAEDK